MKTLYAIFLLAITATVGRCDPITFTTKSGKQFVAVNVIDENKYGATVQDGAGTKTFIKVFDLPDNLRKECQQRPHHSLDSINGAL